MSKKKVTAYQVMEAQSKSALVDNMEVHLAQGWQPCGGVSAKPSGYEERWIQAIVLYDR